MRDYFVDDKLKFKGYREAAEALERMRKPGYTPTESDLDTVYRMLNYVIPYDGNGSDARGSKDVKTQRTKFFKSLKSEGYGACLDTNDSIYGGFKTTLPVIMFDMEQIVPKETYRTTMSDKRVATVVGLGRRAFGV
jgi:hypothetical protein